MSADVTATDWRARVRRLANALSADEADSHVVFQCLERMRRMADFDVWDRADLGGAVAAEMEHIGETAHG